MGMMGDVGILKFHLWALEGVCYWWESYRNGRVDLERFSTRSLNPVVVINLDYTYYIVS